MAIIGSWRGFGSAVTCSTIWSNHRTQCYRIGIYIWTCGRVSCWKFTQSKTLFFVFIWFANLAKQLVKKVNNRFLRNRQNNWPNSYFKSKDKLKLKRIALSTLFRFVDLTDLLTKYLFYFSGWSLCSIEQRKPDWGLPTLLRQPEERFKNDQRCQRCVGQKTKTNKYFWSLNISKINNGIVSILFFIPSFKICQLCCDSYSVIVRKLNFSESGFQMKQTVHPKMAPLVSNSTAVKWSNEVKRSN